MSLSQRIYRNQPSLFRKGSDKPVSLLSSDTDDNENDHANITLFKRIGYQDLIDRQGFSSYHRNVIIFLEVIEILELWFTYLPLLFVPFVFCEWGDLGLRQITTILLSYHILGFISPLVHIVFEAKGWYRASIIAFVTLGTLFILSSLGSVFVAGKKFYALVLCRGLAGFFVIPKSIKTKMWSHAVPQRYHGYIKTMLGLTQPLLLFITIMLLCVLYSSALGATDISKVIFFGVTSSIFVVFCICNWKFKIVSSPINLIEQRNLSNVLRSIWTICERDMELSYVRLHEIDFHTILQRKAWDPTYLCNEKFNKMNRKLLYVYVFVSGYLHQQLLAVTSITFVNAGCWMSLSTENCFVNTSHHSNFNLTSSPSAFLLFLITIIIWTAFSITRIKLKYKTLVSLIALVLLEVFLPNVCELKPIVTIALAALAFAFKLILDSVIVTIQTTTVTSVYVECLTTFCHLIGIIGAKVLMDYLHSALSCYIIAVITSGVAISSLCLSDPMKPDMEDLSAGLEANIHEDIFTEIEVEFEGEKSDNVVEEDKIIVGELSILN